MHVRFRSLSAHTHPSASPEAQYMFWPAIAPHIYTAEVSTVSTPRLIYTAYNEPVGKVWSTEFE